MNYRLCVFLFLWGLCGWGWESRAEANETAPQAVRPRPIIRNEMLLGRQGLSRPKAAQRITRKTVRRKAWGQRWRIRKKRIVTNQERLYWGYRAIQVAQEEGIPSALFLRLIRQESGFSPYAISPVGAIGLTQLTPETARSLGVNPYDPEQNLRGGGRYLRKMLIHFRGDVVAALAAYNAGPLAVHAYRTGTRVKVGKKVINAALSMRVNSANG